MSYLKATEIVRRQKVVPYLDAFLIVDPADHPHTHLRHLTEGWLLQTDVSEDLDHPFSYADTSVLHTKKKQALHQKQSFCFHTQKKHLHGVQ